MHFPPFLKLLCLAFVASQVSSNSAESIFTHTSVAWDLLETKPFEACSLVAHHLCTTMAWFSPYKYKCFAWFWNLMMDIIRTIQQAFFLDWTWHMVPTLLRGHHAAKCMCESDFMASRCRHHAHHKIPLRGTQASFLGPAQICSMTLFPPWKALSVGKNTEELLASFSFILFLLAFVSTPYISSFLICIYNQHSNMAWMNLNSKCP